jgi:hypothetical protein
MADIKQDARRAAVVIRNQIDQARVREDLPEIARHAVLTELYATAAKLTRVWYAGVTRSERDRRAAFMRLATGDYTRNFDEEVV